MWVSTHKYKQLDTKYRGIQDILEHIKKWFNPTGEQSVATGEISSSSTQEDLPVQSWSDFYKFIVICAQKILKKLSDLQHIPNNETKINFMKGMAILVAIKIILANHKYLNHLEFDIYTLSSSFEHERYMDKLKLEAYIFHIFDYKYICPSIMLEQTVKVTYEDRNKLSEIHRNIDRRGMPLELIQNLHVSPSNNPNPIDFNVLELPTHTIVSRVGKGSFGEVFRMNDGTGIHKVIKRIEIGMAVGAGGLNEEIYREVMMMATLDHENIVKALNFGFNRELTRLDILMEEMIDLNKYVQNMKTLPKYEFVLDMTKQLLEGCKYLHSLDIVHRDLKPQNLLVDKHHTLKVADLGHARYMFTKRLKEDLVDYDVVTHWYRPLEILLKHKDGYTAAIDMWSVGCIISELCTGKPLFPGDTDLATVQMIIKRLRKDEQLLSDTKLGKLKYCRMLDDYFEIYSNDYKRWLPIRKPRRKKIVECRFPNSSIQELLEKMLDYDYSKRITAEQSLKIIEDSKSLKIIEDSKNTLKRAREEETSNPLDSKSSKNIINKICDEKKIGVMKAPELIQQLKLHGTDKITRGSEIVDLRKKLINLCKK